MKRVVISQPMFFPWVGLFEQIRLADVYVHYDDVQFSKGHFVNRVQVKTVQGSHWLTVPLKNHHLGQRIDGVRLDDTQPWRQRHLALLSQAYRDAPFLDVMLKLVRDVYEQRLRSLADLAIASMDAVRRFLDLASQTEFLRSSALVVPGTSSRRVLDIVRHVGGDVYITGHGARNYLDHDLFEANGIRVEYIDYQKRAYPQLHGGFTPFVSVLDLIANVGTAGRDVLVSPTVYWKDFLATHT
jgi:hypothetical protein